MPDRQTSVTLWHRGKRWARVYHPIMQRQASATPCTEAGIWYIHPTEVHLASQTQRGRTNPVWGLSAFCMGGYSSRVRQRAGHAPDKIFPRFGVAPRVGVKDPHSSEWSVTRKKGIV